jgi:hypothetical protein
MFQARIALRKPLLTIAVTGSLIVARRIPAGTLSGAFSSVAAGSNVNLTSDGKLDWVHWGLYTDTSVNRKASVPPMIGNMVLLADTNSFAAVYQYANNANGYSWFDGAPVVSVTNSTTGVWAYSTLPIGTGFQLTVPADSAPKTLVVYVGAYNARGQFAASLSDGSAPSFTSGIASTVDNIGNGPGGAFTIVYAANSPGQTLTVTWTVGLPHGSDANVTLQAATLTAPGANNPPYVAVSSPPQNSAFAEPANISLTATAEDFDGTVTNVAFYAGTNKLASATTSPYAYAWNGVARGHYVVTAAATDNAGTTSYSPPVDVFVYGSGGSLSGVVDLAPASVDLTSEGTSDWTHWGLVTNSSFDYKEGVQRKISNFSALGTNVVQQYMDNYAAFSWSDGAPTLSAQDTRTGVFLGGTADGFRLTVPADTMNRRLRLYVGGYGVEAELQAVLSDLSAAPVTDTSVSNVYDSTNVVYTFDYAAASSGQQLAVVYRSRNLFDLAYGNVTLQAATLQGGGSDPQPVTIIDPHCVGTDFVLSFNSQPDHSYAIEFAPSLVGAAWQTSTNVTGTGGTITVTNHNPDSTQRFYRVETH